MNVLSIKQAEQPQRYTIPQAKTDGARRIESLCRRRVNARFGRNI